VGHTASAALLRQDSKHRDGDDKVLEALGDTGGGRWGSLGVRGENRIKNSLGVANRNLQPGKINIKWESGGGGDSRGATQDLSGYQ